MPLGQLLNLCGIGDDGHVMPLLSRMEIDIYAQKHATIMIYYLFLCERVIKNNARINCDMVRVHMQEKCC